MVIPKLLSNLKWTYPASIIIEDWKLAVLSYIGKFCVFVYLVVAMIINDGYLYFEEPGGYPTIWFEMGDLVKVQQAPVPDYCTNAKDYNWNYGTNPSWWDDINITCTKPDFTELYRKSIGDAWAMTYYKEEHIMKQPCAANKDDDACAFFSNPPVGRNATSQVIDGVCSCGKLSDHFAIGVEDLRLCVQHAFTTSASLGYVSGSSVNKPNDIKHDEMTVRTCVKKKPASEECDKRSLLGTAMWSECCELEHAPGEETLCKTVGEWVAAAGIDLDARALEKIDEDPFTGLLPYRRTSGVKLTFHMRYFGRTDFVDDPVLCELDVQAVDGWLTEGSYTNHVDYTTASLQEYEDKYRRGIAFNFKPSGVLKRLDWALVINTLVSALVFLSLVDTAVGVYAFYCHKNKIIYNKARGTLVSYDDSLARFGVQMALACHAFKQWDNSGHGNSSSSSLDADEFAAVFQPFLSEKQAKHIAERVIAAGGCVRSGKAGSIHPLTFCDMFAEMITVEEFQQEVEKSHQRASQADMIEDMPKDTIAEEDARDKIQILDVSKESNYDIYESMNVADSAAESKGILGKLDEEPPMGEQVAAEMQKPGDKGGLCDETHEIMNGMDPAEPKSTTSELSPAGEIELTIEERCKKLEERERSKEKRLRSVEEAISAANVTLEQQMSSLTARVEELHKSVTHALEQDLKPAQRSHERLLWQIEHTQIELMNQKQEMTSLLRNVPAKTEPVLQLEGVPDGTKMPQWPDWPAASEAARVQVGTVSAV